MDILVEIYDILLENEYIKEHAEGHIKFYEYPQVKEVDNPKIIIDPIDTSTPSDYADDNWLTYDYTIQIEVWSKDRKKTDEIANEIRNVMWEKLGFHQKAGPKGFEDGVFRDARRYRGKIYRDDLEELN